MLLGKTGRECRLNFRKIAPRHGWTDIHSIRMESLESTLAAPERKKPSIAEEGHQKVLVIACQGDDGGRPFTTCKSLDHAYRARTAIDVIAQENRHGMIEGPRLHVGFNAPGHFPEQIVTAMNIADAIH